MAGWNRQIWSGLSKYLQHRSLNKSYTFDPLEPDYVINPYPFLTFLRDQQPLHRSKSGAWLISRYDDVCAALEDERLSNAPSQYAVVSKRNAQKYVCAEVANHILPFIDSPEHTQKRFTLGRSYFSTLKSHLVFNELEAMALRTLQPLKQQGSFDVIHQFGKKFSGEVICRLMGLPVKDLNQLAAWSESFLYLFSFIPSDEMLKKINRSLNEFRAYLKVILEEKRQNPTKDWISSIVLEHDGLMNDISEVEIIDNLMLFFADGIENIDRALGTSIKLLVEHPEQMDAVQNDLTLIEALVDEVLRFETPAQFIGRVTKTDIELNGQYIKAQTPILLMLNSANRDQRQFKNADKFSIFQPQKSILTFGKGAHSCIGKTLVKKQMAAGLLALLSECSSIELIGKLEWEPRIGHRWLKRCLIKVT